MTARKPAKRRADVVPATKQEWRTWIRSAHPGDIRRGAGVQQKDLAVRVGVGVCMLHAWEHGYTMPSDQERGAEWFRAVREMGRAG